MLINGLHHITAISANAIKNFHFYTQVLGLRFVKKTVNFDDPHTYHFYYGNYAAEPGSIMTFFPWQGMVQGRRGASQATETAFAVPSGSLDYWVKRLDAANVLYSKPAARFDEEYVAFYDPDGLKVELVASLRADARPAIDHSEIPAWASIRGFHGVTLTLNQHQPTARLLTDVMDFEGTDTHVNRYRFRAKASGIDAAVVDIVHLPTEMRGHVAAGSVHHVAFRAKTDADEMAVREKILQFGLNITEPIDRNYFHSLYFREPGGILFEIATDNPGFTVDEPLEQLGTSLKLPAMYEARRKEIEQVLPALK
jgi:glyoxalase family protein